MNEVPADVSGVLVIDKSPGWTSMDVCARVRTLVGKGGGPRRAKVGHAGTLDPFATGVLVVLVGSATRRSDEMMAGEKEYLADIELDRTSDTFDPTGRVEVLTGLNAPAAARVAEVCRAFVGTIAQRPPAHSAVHIGGERSYERARRGEAVEPPPRMVDVHELEITGYVWPTLRVRVRCGKGTYIRSLARDIGAALGVGGMLSALRRTRVGSFTLAGARTMESLGDAVTASDLLPNC